MGLAQIKKAQESVRLEKEKAKLASVDGKTTSEVGKSPLSRTGIGQTRIKTVTKLSEEPEKYVVPAASASDIPSGYFALGKNDVAMLMAVKEEIILTGICSLDYETKSDTEDDSSTQDPQDNQMVGVSVSWKVGTAVYLPVAHDSYAANWDVNWLVDSFLKPVLEHPDVVVIAHNAKFEAQISILHGIDLAKKAYNRKLVDTMILVKALAHPDTFSADGRVIVGLKNSAKVFLTDKAMGKIHDLIAVEDVKSYKDTVGTKQVPVSGEFYKTGAKRGQQKTTSVVRTFNELPVDKTVIDYGCSDADWALGLYHKLLPWCEKEGLMETLWELDFPFTVVLAEMELAGWHVNRAGLEGMRRIANDALAEILPKLDKAVGEVTQGYADFDDDGNLVVPEGFYGMGEWRGNHIGLEIKSAKPFNWNSTQHQQWLFFHVLKVNTIGLERSKDTGLVSCGKDNMEKIIERFEGDTEFIKLLKEKKKYDKIMSTYVEGLLPYCREDTDKVHSNLNLVATWRLSSKKPNLW